MDQNPLVTMESARRFLAEFDKECPVQLAFWVKESNKINWHLYIVARGITDENIDEGYGKVLDAVQRLGHPSFDPFRVKLIEADDPLAKAALETRCRTPVSVPIPYHGNSFGGLEVDWVFVYDSPISVHVA